MDINSHLCKCINFILCAPENEFGYAIRSVISIPVKNLCKYVLFLTEKLQQLLKISAALLHLDRGHRVFLISYFFNELSFQDFLILGMCAQLLFPLWYFMSSFYFRNTRNLSLRLNNCPFTHVPHLHFKCDFEVCTWISLLLIWLNSGSEEN